MDRCSDAAGRKACGTSTSEDAQVELDRPTLLVVFGGTALTMAVLFYFDVYRRGRAEIAGWWCAAVGFFAVTAAGFLLDELLGLEWAYDVGVGFMVAANACIWGGARSISGRSAPKFVPVALWAIVTLAAFGAGEAPSNLGRAIVVALMGIALAWAALEMRRAPAVARSKAIFVLVAAACSAYYFARTIGLLVLGPEHHIFQGLFSPGVSLVAAMPVLIVASYSMTSFATAQLTAELTLLASTDLLTGLLNRRAFMEAAARRMAAVADPDDGLVLVIADLDRLKAVNDTFGHPVGDEVISLFGSVCRQTVRSTDLVGRYGGEEFILLLDGADAASAEPVCQRINDLLAAGSEGTAQGRVSASFGATTVRQHDTLDGTIRRADQALYAAKRSGRNRFVNAEDG
ncbi:diguanylate cyclase [Arthrobacter sp. M4]|uniref:GGDEF domain-containing protein n=1 Tax=Arthrobacter sp. M4 TaxID=218160 RepID=UPI001CDD5225|nr:GGDEF domain-containing protein [Arthrobacter sp. M4]MCA4133785.1 GGDEF domain-containing protein [Arthrobacter sp. M4]